MILIVRSSVRFATQFAIGDPSSPMTKAVCQDSLWPQTAPWILPRSIPSFTSSKGKPQPHEPAEVAKCTNKFAPCVMAPLKWAALTQACKNSHPKTNCAVCCETAHPIFNAEFPPSERRSVEWRRNRKRCRFSGAVIHKASWFKFYKARNKIRPYTSFSRRLFYFEL